MGHLLTQEDDVLTAIVGQRKVSAESVALVDKYADSWNAALDKAKAAEANVKNELTGMEVAVLEKGLERANIYKKSVRLPPPIEKR